MSMPGSIFFTRFKTRKVRWDSPWRHRVQIGFFQKPQVTFKWSTLPSGVVLESMWRLEDIKSTIWKAARTFWKNWFPWRSPTPVPRVLYKSPRKVNVTISVAIQVMVPAIKGGQTNMNMPHGKSFTSPNHASRSLILIILGRLIFRFPLRIWKNLEKWRWKKYRKSIVWY